MFDIYQDDYATHFDEEDNNQSGKAFYKGPERQMVNILAIDTNVMLLLMEIKTDRENLSYSSQWRMDLTVLLITLT